MSKALQQLEEFRAQSEISERSYREFQAENSTYFHDDKADGVLNDWIKEFAKKPQFEIIMHCRYSLNSKTNVCRFYVRKFDRRSHNYKVFVYKRHGFEITYEKYCSEKFFDSIYTMAKVGHLWEILADESVTVLRYVGPKKNENTEDYLTILHKKNKKEFEKEYIGVFIPSAGPKINNQ